MRTVRPWRQSAPQDENTDSRAFWLGVSELRQAYPYLGKREAQEERASEAQETPQEQVVTSFSCRALGASATHASAFLILAGETFPGKSPSGNLPTHESKSLRIRQFPPVVAERLFVKVPKQVERLHADVGPVQLPLNETPEVLHRVRVDVAPSILNRVIDDGVIVVRRKPVVGLQFVAEQRRSRRDMLAYPLLQVTLAPIGDVKGSHLAAALHNTERNGFIFAARARNDALTLHTVHVAGLAADERLVHFNLTGELGSSLVLHGFANPVQHEPRGFLRHAKVPSDLIAADTVAAIGNQPDSRKPLVETNSGLVEDRPDFDGELLTAFAALPDAPRLEEHRLRSFAMRANHAVRPTLGCKVVQSVVGIGEVLDGFGQCFGGFHASSVA